MDDPHHPQFGEAGPDLDVQTLIHKMAAEARENNTYLSISTFRARVFAVHGQTVSKSTMHRWLQGLGYTHSEKKLTGLRDAYTCAKIRRFILDYSKALRAERASPRSVVLVWMDESYIHQLQVVSRL